METILLYVGTILIASEIARDVQHITIFITAPYSIVVHKLLPKLALVMSKSKKSSSFYFKIFRKLIKSVIIILTIAIMSPVFALIFITQLIMLPNYLLNRIYSKLLRMADNIPAMHNDLILFLGSAFSLASTKVEGLPTNDKDVEINLNKVINKPRIPFNGILGLVLVTISFILELISR